MGLEMEENNTELEEGEASCYYKDDEENVDPDNDLSYIDERLQHALGHFQKDFEGGAFAESLGPKYGGYGSFLPSYERSSAVWSHPKTPQKSYNTSRSPKSLMEGATQNLKASSSAPPTARLGTVNSAHLSHNSRVPPRDISVKQDSCVPSTQVAERCSLKDETLNKLGNPTDLRTLKVRIKMNSDTTARKNVAIYSGLGLNSPSSSLENSPEESGDMPPPSQVTVDESPTNIIQVMTSFPVPGDALISPLHDSLLCLIRKRKVPSSKGHQEHSSLSVEESVSTRGNRKVSKETKIKVAGKGESLVKLKLENGIKNRTRILMKKKSETETLEGKELLPNDLGATPFSNLVCDVGDPLKGIGRTSEASREANENEVKGRFSSSELVKEESLESISGQGCVKNEKQKSRYGSLEKVWEQKDVPVHLRDDGKCKGYKTSAPQHDTDVSKVKEEPDLHRHNAGKKCTSHEQEKTNVPGKRAKLSVEGRIKSKENQSNEKPPTVSTKESLGFEMGVVPKDELSGGHGVPPSGRKIRKLKSQKDKVIDNQRDSFGGKSLEQRNKMDLAERPADDIEVKWKACLDKPKEKLSGKKIDNRLVSKDAPHSCQPTMENGLASEVVPAAAAAAPIVIEENWVCCDKCQKWRLLPFGTKPEQLPEKWLCSMLNWLPGMNRCDISEEETTKALNALYQPSSESLNKPQAHANGTASAVPAVNVLNFDQNHQKLSSHAMSNQGKKKHGLKEIPDTGSGSGLLNTTKNHLQEAVKSISSKDINRPPLESNPMKKSGSRQMSKLQNLGMEKSTTKQKEKHTSGGDTKKVRLKYNGADQYTCGASKKLKREETWHGDKNRNAHIDLGKVGVGSSTGLLTQARGQDIKYNDLCYSEDTKDVVKDIAQVPAKKLRDQTQVSCPGGSLDVRKCSRGDSSMKKRKMRDWQDTQNNVETFQNFAHEGKVYSEESSESGYQKEKKSKILKTDGKESSTSNGDDKSNRKSRVTQIVMSGTKVHSVDAMEKDRSIVKDQQPGKHSKQNASEQTLDGVNSLKRDLGSVSLAATSSSSKVSGSHKTRVNFEEVKGSPVESVSSSPLRTSHSDRLTSSRGDAFGKDDAVYGDFPPSNIPKRFWDGDETGNIDKFVTTRKKKISCSTRPESHKFSSVGCHDIDANGEFSVKAKPSSEVWSSHLLSGNDSLEPRGQCLSNQHGMDRCHDDDRENKKQTEVAVCVQKSGKGSCLQSKDNVRSCTSDLDRNKVKVSDPVNDHSKKSQRYEPEIECNHQAFVLEKGNNVRHNLPKKCSTKSVKVKDDNYHVSRVDNAGNGSSDSGVETQVGRKEYDVSDVKFSATQSPNRKGARALQQNLIQNHGDSQIQNDPRSGKPQLFSHCQGERKEETPSLCSRPVAGSEREVVFQGLPVNATVNGDESKSVKQSGTSANKNGINCNLVHFMPDQQRAMDVSSPSPVRSSSGQTASNSLKEAKRLRDYADYLKNSGFDFESSEAYFQAALKFLQGAVLLESCSSENGKHGDMTQLQVYSTTAKLCELCAHEYETRNEVTSAALAYKCMEVAYMRVVYCKHSSTNRDRHELQATLNIAPPGESPSSSASDVDNLNNQVIAEKAVLSKGTGIHVSGNHVVVARNRPNFVRLLDFTQDVNFAMEATRKSQNAFAAACATLEDAHKNDCICSIKRVIDFSFQDLEELIRLVKLAMEAISRSKFGGARD